MALQTLRRAANYAALASSALRLQRADDEQVRQRMRQHLIQRMGRLRGLPQKLGQMLSFSHDESGAAQQYETLQQGAEPLPLESLLPSLEQAWQRPMEEVVAQIDPRGLAASLGQVHQAVLQDGRQVAIKIQYPGIRQAAVADLRMLGWLSLPVGNLRRGFDLAGYRQVIMEDLDRELDYQAEAATQRHFSALAATDRFLIVPTVIDPLSAGNVLVTDWETGDTWQQVQAEWSSEEQRQLSRELVRWFLQGLFQHGILHADLHPGNVRFRRTAEGPRLVLYDYGCVYRPAREQAIALAALIRATGRQEASPWPLMMKLGFNAEYLEPLADRLPAVCQLLFEPMTANHPYCVGQWRLSERLADVLGDERWNFRMAGPPEIILLLRAFHGIRYYLQAMNQPVAWQPIVEWHLSRLQDEMNRLPLPMANEPRHDFGSLARFLKIRVSEGAQTKACVTSRAGSIDHLEELIDDRVLEQIRQQGINLAEVVAKVRRHGYLPGPVFQLRDNHKQVQVWLE